MEMTSRSRWSISLSMYGFLMLLLLAAPRAMQAQVIVPVNGVTPPLTAVAVTSGTGNHFDPHISGDWLAYTTELDHSIRYYNFVTNVDAKIPTGNSVNDLLAEIRGSKIVFTRVISLDPSGLTYSAKVMVFDAATPAVAPVELASTPGDHQIDCSIGGNTVAFIDYATHPNGDLVVYDLATSTLTRLTDETGPEANLIGPEVSDDGNVVVWSKFKSFPFNYRSEVWQAVRSGGIWTVHAVSTAADPRLDSDPDTNGTLAVYSSDRNSIYDIYWRPVIGGDETRLDIPGYEFDPNITGNYICYVATPELGGFSNLDVFLYDISHNRIFRLTDTPVTNERLCEVTILDNGAVRAVWDSDEVGLDDRNIHAVTFTPPTNDTTPPVLGPLTDVVVTLPLNSIATSMPVTFPLPTATDDSGSVTVTTNPASGATFGVGKTTVNVTATDLAGNTALGSFTVTVLHNFSGFLQPVDNLPTLNVVNAGQAIPVKFSLSGNKGLNIFAAGYPASGQTGCDANEPGSEIEETVSAGGSSLGYDAGADRYTYVWKTEKAWKGTCRILALRLSDGTDHFAKFRFK